uniref:Uncharacterized protein n=1 Tax=Glossina pallidipes TaxID=7398 RepID=A0A1A9ZU17_GLOPL
MARAFYIPNNAKFLPANRRQQQEQQQQEDRPTTSHNNQPSNYTQPSASASVEAEDIEQSGCWDILAQLFCFAARFFGPDTTTPIFHISLEIHNNPAAPTVNSAETQTQTVDNATK